MHTRSGYPRLNTDNSPVLLDSKVPKKLPQTNSIKDKEEITVITEVKPSDGPFCASSLVVGFYVPKDNQANAPSADLLHLQKWGLTYVAVRQFSGFVKDEDVGEEAAALYSNVSGTVWRDAIEKSRSGDNATEYIIAQYNSPFEFRNRLNEVWLTFDLEDNCGLRSDPNRCSYNYVCNV
ncbi:uncharacterized protein [Primulina huaijiensis]|uniref:uncharacterized protein n=1 Tax=Primulina huaijiensis TaxID=1492673 RepID=UPI003CC769A3